VKLERQRYILVEYLTEGHVEEKQILSALWHTFTRLFGEVNAGSVGLYVITHDMDARRLILRCAHGQRDNVITAMTLTRKITGKRVAFCTRLTSGTLLSLKRKSRTQDPSIK
jgi:RNase P/RNase MRP subunit POP5